MIYLAKGKTNRLGISSEGVIWLPVGPKKMSKYSVSVATFGLTAMAQSLLVDLLKKSGWKVLEPSYLEGEVSSNGQSPSLKQR